MNLSFTKPRSQGNRMLILIGIVIVTFGSLLVYDLWCTTFVYPRARPITLLESMNATESWVGAIMMNVTGWAVLGTGAVSVLRSRRKHAAGSV